MPGSEFFPRDYRSGRGAFLAAAKAADSRLASYGASSSGPDGGPLYTDVAVLGREDAPHVLFCNSATHGVEGFCGSGLFTGWLASGGAAFVPPNVKVILVHALNCHGFAWLRRATEENVDLNRSFVDHAAPYPKNDGYTRLHPLLLPDEWSGRAARRVAAALADFARKDTWPGLFAALGAGQYSHPDGICFGGQGPTATGRRFLQIVEDHVRGAGFALFLDWHTGLGAYGAGQIVDLPPRGAAGARRARAWFAHELASPVGEEPLPTRIAGTVGEGLHRSLAGSETKSVRLTVEFGTYAQLQVLLALVADNWLHQRGDPESLRGRMIKVQVRKALYPDEDDWKELVWTRGRQLMRRALTGLAGLR